jgi:hypothetical protein
MFTVSVMVGIVDPTWDEEEQPPMDEGGLETLEDLIEEQVRRFCQPYLDDERLDVSVVAGD